MGFRRLVLWGLTAVVLAGVFAAKDDFATLWLRARLKQISASPVALERAAIRLGRNEIELHGLQLTVSRPSVAALIDVDRLLLRFNRRAVLQRRLELDYVRCEVGLIEIVRQTARETEETVVPSASGQERLEVGSPIKTPGGSTEAAKVFRLPIERLDLRVDRLRYRDADVSDEFQQLPLRYEASFRNVENPRSVLLELMEKPVMGRPLSAYFGWDV